MKLENRVEKPAASEGGKQPRDQKSVILYIMVLFIAAFLLMALSFAMHQRSNTEALGQLQNSLSVMGNTQALQERIISLQEELDSTKEQLNRTEESLTAALQALSAAEQTDTEQLQAALQEKTALAEQYSQDLTRTVQAMDLFWQIDEAYVLNRTSRCRELIQLLESQELAVNLPADSTTDNGRFSPYDRYAEICEALRETYGAGVHG